MVMYEWAWRTPEDIPEEVLLVVTRTRYNPKAWNVYGELLEAGYHRFMGDAHIVGAALWTQDDERVSWAATAWKDYKSLRDTVYEQVEWLAAVNDKLDTGNQTRHNAYRVLSSDSLPLPRATLEDMVFRVMRVSPLGADAFPELSKALGINGGSDHAEFV